MDQILEQKVVIEVIDCKLNASVFSFKYYLLKENQTGKTQNFKKKVENLFWIIIKPQISVRSYSLVT